MVCNKIYSMETHVNSLDFDLRKMFPEKELIDSYEFKMSYEQKEMTKDQLLLNDLSAQEEKRKNKDIVKVEKLESHLVKAYYE